MKKLLLVPTLVTAMSVSAFAKDQLGLEDIANTLIRTGKYDIIANPSNSKSPPVHLYKGVGSINGRTPAIFEYVDGNGFKEPNQKFDNGDSICIEYPIPIGVKGQITKYKTKLEIVFKKTSKCFMIEEKNRI